MNQWFRMYSEFATDVKVQSMNETLQRRFIMFLCLHCNGEYERLNDDELAFALRITPAELIDTRGVFIQKGFLDDNGKIRNWNKRQYKSDSSTERVQKHRERQRNDDETLQKRPQIQRTDTDTDSEKNPSASATPKRVKVSRETVSPDFMLDLKLCYPERSGDPKWRAAEQAANARLAEGNTEAEMLAGARRYAAFCQASGKVGTEFVKQASSFFGPGKPFLLPWTPPPTKGDIRQNANINAAQEWLNA